MRIHRGKRRPLIVVLALAMMLAACGGGQSDELGTGEEAGTTEDPQEEADAEAEADAGETAGGEVAEQVSVAVANFPPSAEPWTGVGSPGQFMWSAVFDALTVIDDSGTPQPALAESWEAVDDTTWHFVLRDGVEFHNGDPLTVEDVVGTFELLLSEEGAASYGSHVGNYSFIESVSAVDDTTVEITTSRPAVLLPASISIVYVVPIAHFEEVGAGSFATEPVGTGPYQSVTWSSDRIELERYEDSWRDAQVANLEFVNLNDPAARNQALQSGQVDVILASGADAVIELESAGFESYVARSGRVMSVAFITNDGGPLADQTVRQALNYAVDSDAIAEALVGGLTEASAWPPEGVNGYDPARDPYPYDPELARQMLEEAGYGDGFDISAEVTLGAFPADREIYESVASYLGEVGVNLELIQVDFAQEWLPKYTGAGGADWSGEAFGSTWVSPPVLDAVRPLTQYRCDWSNPWFCDADLDAMLDDVDGEFDADARNDKLGELLDYVREHAPVLWLIETVDLWVTAPDVDGWEVHSFNPTYEQLS
ncbi:ABC transporter substrate-binding protein [Egicoccus sp. AB-alg2]|uniref:ABC transporter substrate-binding protein n=1 Tax=Egicoccus sp. AB-alg2 TaxID=3242693 RepID=UPI00359DADC3